MSLIEGVGDEVTQFFALAILIVIGYLAWWTTNIAERPAVRTIFLLDRRRVRRRLTNHTETVTIVEGNTSDLEGRIEETDIEESDTAEVAEVTGVSMKPPEEPSTSSDTASDTSTRTLRSEGEEEEEEEQGIIIRKMDENADVLRRRRCNYYDSKTSNAAGTSSSPDISENVCTENVCSKSETESSSQTCSHDNFQNQSNITKENSIHIKLKYINDDVKLVDGSLQEQLGDFKKRHFQGELSTNKLVRLIFNGQVLQPDTVTLKSCGLFNNCVVHCLVHQKRPQSNEENISPSRVNFYTSTLTSRNTQPNNNTQREWDLGNFLFGVLTFGLFCAWYVRYAYAYLYTLTATIMLVILTVVFTIAIIGMYFPNTDSQPRTQRAAS